MGVAVDHATNTTEKAWRSEHKTHHENKWQELVRLLLRQIRYNVYIYM